jgi:lipopolysaccharide export system protein LptA
VPATPATPAPQRAGTRRRLTLTSPRLAVLLACLAWLALLVVAVAQEDAGPADDAEPGARRLITIDSSGGTQSGNLRFGPIVYQHPEPDGVVATVSTLTIRGPRAELTAPEGELIAQAQGRREASFDGGVVVTRGRLTAVGAALTYAEATGLGVLAGEAGARVEVRIAPADEREQEVLISADRVTFDVDTDTSVSEGMVRLLNGDQAARAERLEYEEVAALGVLSGTERPEVVRTADDGGELRIVADEIRVLTDISALYAVGSVRVEDGDITSEGDVVFYDDDEEVAEVLGDPAIAVDAAAGVRLETARVRQDVRFRFVEAMDASLPTPYTVDQFLLAREALP